MIDTSAIVRFHDSRLARRNWPHADAEPVTPGPWCWIYANHRYNTLLWHEENRERIACYRQRRNHARDAIDAAILALLEDPPPAGKAGAMISRLSILSLRIFYMHAQSLRLRQQRAGLLASLDQLLTSK
ncbi:MAG: hypothetical protein U1A73_28510 [Pseudomonas sp.]|nr:hypothetical protein [Pseudomonas sp.]